MTTNVDIVNRALLAIGTRTDVTAAELLANDTNEAKAANLVLENIRDDLLRMAPWDCALRTANLQYITSAPGTPENTSAATTLWAPGQPAPPWAYEYQYPRDCLRACWIIPATQTGFSGVPITTAVTGGAASFWSGPPVRFKVQTDMFKAVTGVTKVSGGTGYVAGEIITLPLGPTTSAPIGGPVQIRVLTVTLGVITTYEVVSQVMDAETPIGGSYFAVQTGTILQDTSNGAGTGASFTLTQNFVATPQRVILTNQEFATLAYCMQVTDPNVMDTMFQSAWTSILGAALAMALQGDKANANRLVSLANDTIEKARAVDGNEGLTINDFTPDWIRTRGIDFDNGSSGPYSSFDWGGLWPSY